MRLQGLHCRLSTADPERLETKSWSGTPQDLADAGAGGVYLVGDGALETLRRFTDIVNDRGAKHDRRALSAILLRQPRVPLAQADFRTLASLRKSVGTLLRNARECGEDKAYVIGLPAARFQEMAARSGVTAKRSGVDADIDTPDLLLLDPVEVPRALEEQVIGESREMHIVRQWIVRAAGHNEPVLILGETGTGKEVVARAIHAFSTKRSNRHFQAVNCGAIPDQLFESEVFGYAPHSFTGAHPRGSLGMWRHARGGTIFLDEIADLAPTHQVKLLRALQEKKIRPVGSVDEIDVDARVIAATNKDLPSMVELGEFREDLYYRIGSMVITLPPLRDRPEDVASLAAFFWKDVAPQRPALAADVIHELRQFRWRGNARELRYVLANLHTAFPKAALTVDHVRAIVRVRASQKTAGNADGVEQTLRHVEYLQHLRRAKAAIEACRRLVRMVAHPELTPHARTRLLAEAGGCLTELQLIGTRPERFDNLSTFEAAHRLAGGLAAFQTLLQRRDGEAARFARKNLKDEAAAAAASIHLEEQRILKLL